MRLFRSVLVGLCVAAAGLVVSAGPASATPTPLLSATLTKSFDVSTVPLNGTATVTLRVANPNSSTTLTGVTVIDTPPAGLVFTLPFNAPFCGGSLVITTTALSLTGGTLIPGDSCTVSWPVRGTTFGAKVNTASAISTTTGPAVVQATATLVVANQPPILTKAFTPSTVAVGATTTLTFTLTNPNPSVALSGITFADPFPGGVGVAANPGVVNTCGGVPSVGPYALAVAYANASLPPGGSCTFSVNITAGSAGIKTNTTTIVSSSAGIGSPATGTLTVTP